MSDFISRQAAIDAIQKLNIPEDMCVFEIMSHVEDEIATLPSAQPEPFMVTIDHELTKDEVERLKQSMSNMPIVLFPSAQPKHGYWIESHEHIYIANVVKEWTNWYCSECDAPNDKPTDYCPNCGTDMRGEYE